MKPTDYPAGRNWAVHEAADLQRFPALAAARTWSCAVLERLTAKLVDLGRHFAEVATVAVSGSLGRLEAGPPSDADLIVVLHTAVPTERCTELMRSLWDVLAQLGLPRPGRTGIYATPATTADLCSASTVGHIQEDLPTFGKRIQLLLDAQPVYGVDEFNDAFATVQTGIVRRYLTGLVPNHSPECWTYLLNDLQRYYRSLRIRNQWNFSTEKGGWFTRSVKQEHSRVLLYAGLLLLLGECSKQPTDQEGWLLARLPLTPLERIAAAFVANGDPYFHRIAAAYDRFLAVLNDPAICSRLAVDPLGLQRPAPALYEELQANGRHLQRELVRFVLARQADWSEAFFVRLFF